MTRRQDDARAAEAVRLYRAGLTTREIGARLGADPRTVARWAGGEVRRRGPRGRTDVADQVILRLRDGGAPGGQMSYREIGARLGMSETGVRQRYYALTGRPRSR